jgi:hypothetical protein
LQINQSKEKEKNEKNGNKNVIKKNETLRGITSNSGSNMIHSGSNTDTYDIFCPKCHIVCGYYRLDGLELCESFLKCDLFVLNLTKIVIKKS